MPQIGWVHFGDLHIQKASDENYLDFLELIEEANRFLAGHIDFAFLPGDNADDGTEDQYKLVREAINQLRIPIKIITGDHDRKTGSLEPFQRYLETKLFRAEDSSAFRLIFLNALDGADAKTFDLSPEQMEWLRLQLTEARTRGLRPLVFVHLYPSELRTQGEQFSSLLRGSGVELVEMGHTHYNELSNDGRILYATTRSTGQIEEGPPGFSITWIDDDVISWKFKERRKWPFVLITSPADAHLITRPASPRHVVGGTVTIRAKAWGLAPGAELLCSVDETAGQPMQKNGECWEWCWHTRETSDGLHRVRVWTGGTDDRIEVYVNQKGEYYPPERKQVDYENAIGAYEAKGILGSQLGPNDNGTKGPWPSWRGR